MFQIFNTFLVIPIINVLLAIYHLLLVVHIPYALGFSIIVLTALIRLVLYPLTASQLKASKKMQELNPHLSKLKEKHKGDNKTLQAETMKLYKEHGVNPAAGCLPMLIQLPFIWALYSVLNKVVHLNPATAVSEINKMAYFAPLKLSALWNTTFFGLPLGKSPSQLMVTLGIIIILVPVITGLFQFIQSKMLFATPSPDAKKSNDFASSFQSQSAYIFPVMIGFFSWTFPIGLSLYWNTFTIFGIIQQYQIQGLGGLESFVKKIKNGKK